MQGQIACLRQEFEMWNEQCELVAVRVASRLTGSGCFSCRRKGSPRRSRAICFVGQMNQPLLGAGRAAALRVWHGRASEGVRRGLEAHWERLLQVPPKRFTPAEPGICSSLGYSPSKII